MIIGQAAYMELVGVHILLPFLPVSDDFLDILAMPVMRVNLESQRLQDGDIAHEHQAGILAVNLPGVNPVLNQEDTLS